MAVSETLKPHCALVPLRYGSGRITQRMRFGARLAPHPYSAAAIKMIKYGGSGTSHIPKR